MTIWAASARPPGRSSAGARDESSAGARDESSARTRVMKVCVVGAGAIGSFIGAHLARGSCDVSALARGATAAALRTHGFRLEQAGGLITAPVRVVEDGASLGPQDLVVLAVKGPSLGGAAQKVTPLLGPDTMVLTAMNGVPWWFFVSAAGGACDGMRLASVDPDG